jgi:hypothetical protein
MSLTSCIKKAGKALNAQDKAAVLAAAREHRKAGLSADAAALQAVEDVLASVRAEMAALALGGRKGEAAPASKPTTEYQLGQDFPEVGEGMLFANALHVGKFSEAEIRAVMAHSADVQEAKRHLQAMGETFSKSMQGYKPWQDALQAARAVIAGKPAPVAAPASAPSAAADSEAPEHANVGVDERELGQIVQEFNAAQRTMYEGDELVTHVMDPPQRAEVVRLAEKVRVYHKDHGWMTPQQAKARIAEWQQHAAQQGAPENRPKGVKDNSQRIVLSLFDLSGKWSDPWAEAGYQVFRFDIQEPIEWERTNEDTGEEEVVNAADINNFGVEMFNDLFGSFDGLDVHAVLAANPCTDFAVSGARHFAAKDSDGRTVASVKLVHMTLATLEYFKPNIWAIENPVGRIEQLGGLPPWRLSFDPNHIGEPYTKKTLLWGRFNADLPIAPVEPSEGSKMHSQYGGKSLKTKNARSATPEGFAYAFFMANNAYDHPVMTLSYKYDRLDPKLIEAAFKAGHSEEAIENAVDDPYYIELDDKAANEALRELAKTAPEAAPAPAAAPAAAVALPPHRINTLTSGIYKGWRLATVTEGEHKDVIGKGRNDEDARKDLARSIAERTAATAPAPARLPDGRIARTNREAVLNVLSQSWGGERALTAKRVGEIQGDMERPQGEATLGAEKAQAILDALVAEGAVVKEGVNKYRLADAAEASTPAPAPSVRVPQPGSYRGASLWWNALDFPQRLAVMRESGMHLSTETTWESMGEIQRGQALSAGSKLSQAAPSPAPAPNPDKDRATAREVERELFRAVTGDAAMTGKSVDELKAALEARMVAMLDDADLHHAVAITRLAPRLAILARAAHKELATREAELRKQEHRHPGVRANALAEAVASAFPDAGAVSPEQHAQFIAGFDHFLKGKTKSTLLGDFLADQQKGYEAAQRWVKKTEEGAAWYEGRPVNKLQNTGVDLRRHWEQMQAQMKANESDIAKAWAQIEKATARADLFAPLLPEGVAPGFRLYVEEFRKHTRPFKDWLQEHYVRWYGSMQGRGRYKSKKTDLEYILEGSRHPHFTTEVKDEVSGRTHNIPDAEQVKRWETDEAFRAAYLREAADKYLAQVRALIAFLENKSSVAEAAAAFEEAYVDPEKVAKLDAEQHGFDGYRAWNALNEAGQKLTSAYGDGPLFAGHARELLQFRTKSPWTQTLIEKEATIALPDKAQQLIPPRLDRVTREGKTDQRKGKSVTPQEVKDTFGLADVGFGKWVGSKQDQDHLNYAYDALMDLANHFGMDPKNIGLGGRLHLTIGALGHGKFAAHFQPEHPGPDGAKVPVINLTNTRGDGTVYHEWVHALDHFLGGEWRRGLGGHQGSVRARVQNYLAKHLHSPEEVDRIAKRFLSGDSFWTNDKNMPKVEAAIQGIEYYATRKVPATAYKANADKLGKDYWGNENELLARAAEAWAGDTLGGTNTYLVNPAWSGEGAITPEKGYRGTPYPTGAERQRFNTVLGALAKAVKWQDGQPTVSLTDFEANLPPLETFDPGRLRREHLSVPKNMRAYWEQVQAEQADRKAQYEREVKDKARREQEELDRLAQAQVDQLAPPPAPDAPPVIDAPPPSDTQGPLDANDLSDLFDQAAAELREEGQESPAAPAPGAAPEAEPEPTPPPVREPAAGAAPSPAAMAMARSMLPKGYAITIERAEGEAADTFHVKRADGSTLAHGLNRTQAGLDEAVRLAKNDGVRGDDARLSRDEIMEALRNGHVKIGLFKVRIEEGANHRYHANVEAPGFNTVIETPHTINAIGILSFYERVADQLMAMQQDLQKSPAPAPAPAAAPQAADVGPLVEYTTRKGKVLRGVVRTDLSKAQARSVDPFTMQVNGGWFIREAHLPALRALLAGAAPEDKTASELIADAAKLGVKGVDEALKGLSALFGKGGTLKAFPGGIDEDTYQQALPHFKAALAAFQASGKSLKDLFKLLIGKFGDGVKPYAVRFAQEEQLTAQLGSQPSASERMARAFAQRLEAGQTTSWQQLFDLADGAFGGTQAEGKYSRQGRLRRDGGGHQPVPDDRAGPRLQPGGGRRGRRA